MTVNNLASSELNYSRLSLSGPSTWQQVRGQRYRQYRERWTQRPLDKQPGRFPLHLDIETTNLCNLKCVMCPRTQYLTQGLWSWSPQGLGHMTWELYTSLINQAAQGGAYSVKLNLLGEPLLHPQVLKQVMFAHQSGLYVMMNTNAVLLDQEMAHGLLEAGIDDVFLSVDSWEKDSYEAIRPGACFETVLKNIENFICLKNKMGLSNVRTRASMVTDLGHPTTDRELAAYSALMNSLGVDEIGFGPEDDHLTDHTDHNMSLGNSPFVCDQIYQRMFITWDGVMVPCCGHWERKYTLGSALEIDLSQAWLSSGYRKLRQAHEGGNFQAISICRSCSVPFLYHRSNKPVCSLESAGRIHD